MDDYDNNDENDEIEKQKKQIDKIKEEAGKEAKRQTKKMLKELAKKAIEALVKVFGKEVLIIIAIVLIILIILPLLWYAIDQNAYNGISNVVNDVTQDEIGYSTGQIKEITSIDGRNIILNTEEFENKINEWFKVNGVDKNTLGISDDLTELKSFLQAEITTLYPDLRLRSEIGTKVEEGTIQGCIKFKRYYEDGTSILLEYMPYEEFSKELAKLGEKLDEEETGEQIYFNKDDVETQYSKLKDKFTLDKNNNLIIVGMYSNQTTIKYSDYAKEEGKKDGDEDNYTFSIQVERVNYQNVVEKYSMPFELCLALLLVTDNNSFSEEVAKLAKNSTIEIDIQDNVTTSRTVEQYSYSAEFNKHRTIVQDNDGITQLENKENIEVKDYKVTTNVVKSNKITLCVKSVETWIASYISTYDNISETTKNVDTANLDDEDYTRVSNSHNLSFPESDIENIKADTKVLAEKKTNRKITYTTTTKTNNYNKSTSNVEEKPEKFLSLLKIDPDIEEFNLENIKKNTKIIKYDTANAKNTSPIDNLIDGQEILYEFLASNSKTVNLEETMKYLIDLYLGNTQLDKSRFSMYEPESFIQVTGNYYGSNFEEKVWFALRSAGYDEYATAGAMGNFKQESGIKANNVQNTYESKVGNDVTYTNKVNNGTYTRQQFISDSVGYGLAQWTSAGRKAGLYDLAKEKGVSIDDEDMQIEFLLKEMQSYGCKKSQPNIKEATDNFHNVFERSADKNLTTRENYAQQIYNKYHGKTEPVGGKIYEIAKQLHDYLRENQYWYPSQLNINAGKYVSDGKSVKHKIPVMGETANNRYVDCSAYVSWVIGKYIGNEKFLCSASQLLSNPMGFKQVSTSQIQPGDILVKNGHTEIYAGNGKTFNTGSTKAIRSETSNYNSSGWVKIFRAP